MKFNYIISHKKITLWNTKTRTKRESMIYSKFKGLSTFTFFYFLVMLYILQHCTGKLNTSWGQERNFKFDSSRIMNSKDCEVRKVKESFLIIRHITRKEYICFKIYVLNIHKLADILHLQHKCKTWNFPSKK